MNQSDKKTEIPDDLISLFKNNSAPLFRKDCLYVIKSRQFVPCDQLHNLDQKDKETAIECLFILQPSLSRMAKCRVCGSSIEKGAFRCGFPIRDCRGQFGTLSGWSHIECSGSLFRVALEDVPGEYSLEEYEKKVDLEKIDQSTTTASVESAFYNAVGSLVGQWGEVPKDVQRMVMHCILTFSNTESVQAAEEILNAKPITAVRNRQPAPSDFAATLLAFQEEGLFWMCKQEETEDVRGGILADEMGMGKTIQTIALLLSKKMTCREKCDEHQAATLIVAPLAAVLQWKKEMELFTKNNALKVMVYHGAYRAALVKEFHLYDVVIVTYATLESDYRKVMNLHKLPCKRRVHLNCVLFEMSIPVAFRYILRQFCGRMFLPAKLNFHLRYFCGDEATRTARQAMTERKTASATEKAMKTLNIKQDTDHYQAPTITNVYRAILSERNDNGITDVKPVIPWLRGNRAPAVRGDIGAESASAASPKKNGYPQNGNDTVISGSVPLSPELSSTRKRKRRTTQRQEKDHAITTPNEDIKSNLLALKFPAHLIEEYFQTNANLLSVEHGANWILNRIEHGEDSKIEQGETTQETLQHVTMKRAHQLRNELGLSATEIKKKTVSELKKILRQIGESAFGTKVELVNRLLLLLFPSSELECEDPRDAWNSLSTSIDGLHMNQPTLIKRDTSTREGRNSSSRTKINDLLPGKYSKATRAKRACILKTTTKRPDKKLSTLSSEDEDESNSQSSDTNGCSVSSYDTQSSDTYVAPQKGKKGKPSSKSTKRNQDDVSDKDESEFEVNISLSPLHVMVWHRIVLDEAHRIKGRTTSSAKSVYALKCNGSRWCLTGTPLQNRVGELYSLIRFLQLKPCAYYYCQSKGCDCASLHYRFKNNQFCVQCGHARMSHYSWFNRFIITNIKKYGCQREGREALKILTSQVLNRVLLRRTKVERANDVKLPALTVLIRRDQLIPAERDFYDSLYKKTATQYNTYVQKGTTLHNFAHIFDLLSRLRQAVDHPYLILYGKNQESVSAEPIDIKTTLCWLCQDAIENDVELCEAQCHHTFHRECLTQYIDSAPASRASQLGCPKCFRVLSVDCLSLYDAPCKIQRSVKRCSILDRINISEFTSSTKMEALLQELTSVQRDDPGAKSIIFSQYTAMLDLIEFRLKKTCIPCAKLVGSLSLESRSNILNAFISDSTLPVILMSLKAGGEGLNLQVANHIFLMEPWWNPAAEMQAIQRAHRIGQTKPVRAIRFICENTVEEKMLQLQEKKQLVFDGTIGAQDSAMAKLTQEDLNFLFQN